MKVLVLNAGSSSLKYQVIDMTDERVLGKGLVECIGIEGSKLTQNGQAGDIVVAGNLKNHTEAFMLVMEALVDKTKGLVKSMSEISVIGHRVLHSGEDFDSSVIVTDEVLEICHKNAVLGPLHMPANIACIESCRKLMPNTPNVAVFDTVFHATMPDYAYMYAINYADYEKYKVRKYGFHGTSHKYVTKEAVRYLGKPHSKIITCHLGNGSSLAAVVDGKCIDTSMGLTPLEGLVMGTRSGDLDAAVVGFLAEQKNMTAADVINYLNKKSGFLGIAGVTDFRAVTARCLAGDKRAQLAANMFAYRIKKYIGSYIAAMGGLDCIVFTGGIGENASYARMLIMQGMEQFGIDFDFEYNEKAPRGKFSELTKPDSKVKVVVIPTNEELMIARDAKELTETKTKETSR
ncbi:MAG: acetate kinase [Clostridia bacterium]|nr:acetate kinase [Clostridia bacterium]